MFYHIWFSYRDLHPVYKMPMLGTHKAKKINSTY